MARVDGTDAQRHADREGSILLWRSGDGIDALAATLSEHIGVYVRFDYTIPSRYQYSVTGGGFSRITHLEHRNKRNVATTGTRIWTFFDGNERTPQWCKVARSLPLGWITAVYMRRSQEVAA